MKRDKISQSDVYEYARGIRFPKTSAKYIVATI
jgi:hypothetical protein